MTDKDMQELWLQNNKPKVIEFRDYSIARDSLKRTNKSSLENNEHRIVDVQKDGTTVKTKKFLNKGAMSTLSNYTLPVEKDPLIGVKIYVRPSTYNLTDRAEVLRKQGNKYYCSDGLLRGQQAIKKQLITDPT